MPADQTLTAHPRLYIGSEAVERVRHPPEHPMLREAGRRVASMADEYVDHPDYDQLDPTHNAHLIRARHMQGRIITLITQWLRSGEPRYRDSAIAHVQTMDRWEYWSWIAWRKQDPRPDALFDLSYGENSATLALAYDLLYDELTDEQRAQMVDIARRRALEPMLQALRNGPPGWFKSPDSNWNTVCAGGAGMLAMAMHEVLEEARQVLPKCDESVEPFMRALETTDGGWPEGIGYWNYGMRYAFMYLLSHERATGAPHRLLEAPATARTLAFPLDFCPHGQPCSFGDVPGWNPLPFHFAAAHRLGQTQVLAGLQAEIDAGRFWQGRERDTPWPVAGEMLLLHPRLDNPPTQTHDATRRAGLYRGVDWGILADRWPEPNLYLAMRGGSTDVPHSHLDLLSFHGVVGDERLIENLAPAEYLDTTFSPRRYELFEMGPHSKNSMLLNGVGITRPAQVESQLIEQDQWSGFRIDATRAMGITRWDQPLAEFCGRLFILFGSHAALVIDRIDLTHVGRVEARLHTRAAVELAQGCQASLTGERQQMTLAFAANLPFELTTSTTSPTTPGDEATMIRWLGPRKLEPRHVMATLLAPGREHAHVECDATSTNLLVRVGVGQWSSTVTLDDQLRPVG